eukprot:2862612-Rhodomonas_salina.4
MVIIIINIEEDGDDDDDAAAAAANEVPVTHCHIRHTQTHCCYRGNQNHSLTVDINLIGITANAGAKDKDHRRPFSAPRVFAPGTNNSATSIGLPARSVLNERLVVSAYARARRCP